MTARIDRVSRGGLARSRGVGEAARQAMPQLHPRRSRKRLALVALMVTCGAPGCAPKRAETQATTSVAAATSVQPFAATSTIDDAATSEATDAREAKSDPELTAPIAQIAASEGVGLVAGPSGHVGAWLALGPFRLDEKAPPASTVAWRPPVRDDKGVVDRKATPLDDHAFVASFGATLPTRIDVATHPNGKDGKPTSKVSGWTTAPATWGIASSGDGAIDLEKYFGSTGKPAVGYLAATLRLPSAMKLLLLIGADDGCEVIVDGTSRFVRDASRPQRDDDDLIPLELTAGDHSFVLKLHQRDSGWALRVRLVDDTLRPPIGARWLLPGAPASSSEELARAMSWVRITREPTAAGWSIATEVRYPEGAPIAAPIEVAASLLAGDGSERVKRHALGVVPIAPRSAGSLSASVAQLVTPAAGSAVSEGAIDFGADEQAQADATVHVDVAGRGVDGGFRPRASIRIAVTRARETLSRWAKEGRPAAIPDDVAATLEFLESRLAQLASHGDADVASQLVDAKELAAFVDDADAGRDPIATRTGGLRLAHYARADGKAQPIALYVPPSISTLKPGAKVPLYVGLHGMNGGPMSMLRVFFGGDDPGKSMGDMERAFWPSGTPPKMPAYGDGFVLAPHGHGNAMYRQLGEEEVMDAIAWVRARYPQIDPDRIYMTGFSMGGIGAASIPLHHPDVFAAAEPLCGYHSYSIRRDVAGRARRPWETFLVDDRSNTEWAANGLRLPLYVIHGQRDLPEENSGVLIDAYKKMKLILKEDHPDLGHDVWGYAYDRFDQVKWFSSYKRTAHPKHVRFRTTRPRFGDDAWVHVDRLASPSAWGAIDAAVEGKAGKRTVVVQTKELTAIHLDRDEEAIGDDALTVVIDGRKLAVAPGEPLVFHRDGEVWSLGAPSADGVHKEGHLAGPIRDVWNEPLTIVYGAGDPAQTTANLEVAQALATIRWGVDVKYPIVKDSEVDPAAAPTKATILIGNARSNRITRALEKQLPIQIVAPSDAQPGGAITFAGKTFTGNQLGAMFVVPHPLATSRYLLVVEGVDALGTWRSLSLPELLPDFVIYDERVAPARGQQLLSFGAVLAGGFFDESWQPPATFADPLLDKVAPAPKSEKDATSYLP